MATPRPGYQCASAAPPVADRCRVRGKFLYLGEEKFYVRGVTYGPFRPEPDGCEYHTPDVVRRDFAAMAAQGINTVRVYTVPPRWLLDIAQECRLKVMVGLPWEQHLRFMNDATALADLYRRVEAGVESCARHPAVLCFAIGNEIPAAIVRWYGPRRIATFLHGLYRRVKRIDPDVLVTYVNFPTTEYLSLPFVDFVCFNVYLETPEKLNPYLARLQHHAGDKPLVLAEIGMDTIRNGDWAQAELLIWQIRATFAAGAAGMFVFAWTDEWFRGGSEIEDWAFGLTDRRRRPKPALGAVAKAYRQVPFPDNVNWPRISVIICSYNGERTLEETCRGVKRLDYPNFEVILINDGSRDRTESTGLDHGLKVITVKNGGLSRARNIGIENATGEIVAYIDDDAWPDPHWLKYLAWTYLTTGHKGVGGPNIPPPGDGHTADCVANSPGGPCHVMLDDSVAEHIPGCNMSFRREALVAIGGFDPQFRIAGDDVDLCWRIQEAGWTIGFSPAAMVWHHRRNRIATYLRQQWNYGRAEAMLERKWPEKYNAAGHVPWAGRIYGKGLIPSMLTAPMRIYHGMWNMAPFQRVYESSPGPLSCLPLMPEWWMLTGALAVLSVLALDWAALVLFVPLLAVALSVPFVQAVRGGRRADFADDASPTRRLMKRLTVTMLHVLQPIYRLRGRIKQGLTPWRRLPTRHFIVPINKVRQVWAEEWSPPEAWLRRFVAELQDTDVVVTFGGDYDAWDCRVRGGLHAHTRVQLAIEEHGGGRQYACFKLHPVTSGIVGIVVVVFAGLSVAAAMSGGWIAAGALALMALLALWRTIYEAGYSLGAASLAVRRLRPDYEAVREAEAEAAEQPSIQTLEPALAQQS